MEQDRTAAPQPAGEEHQGLAGAIGGVGDDVKATVEKVTEAVEDVTSDLSETGARIGEAVRDTAETVKSALDPVGLTRRNPWAAFAGAVFAGFLLGNLLSRAR